MAWRASRAYWRAGGCGTRVEGVDIDSVLDESFRIYSRSFARLVLLAGGVYLVLGLAGALLRETDSGGFGGFLVGVAGMLITLVGLFWLQGALVEATVDLRDGRADVPVPELFRRVRPHLRAVIGAGILASIGIAVGLVLLIVPGLYLLTMWAVLIPVIVLEGKRVGEAFTRSRELVRGRGWQVFGVLLILLLASIVASLIIQGLLDLALPDFLGRWLGSTLANAVVVPFVAVAVTVMYLRLVGSPAEPGPA